ncbi:MAG: cytochrome c3 family protein [Polyangiaceae bacterium]
MPALFPEWADSILRGVLLVGVAGLAGIPLVAMAWARSPISTGEKSPIVQPVKFDHRHHVRDDGIDCLYCHSDARRSPSAGIPATSVCMGCHTQIWTNSPELALVRTSALEETPIVWQRVSNLPQHVFFNHSIHLKKGVGCVSCHGRVDQMAMVHQDQPLSMGWCLDCHREPEKYLRPREEITNMEWKPARPQLEIGRELVSTYDVHPTTDCSGCHR